MNENRDYGFAWWDQIASFNREHLLRHRKDIPNLENSIIEEKVTCLTLNDLCAKHHVEAIDALILDTESYDHELIRSIDWNRFKPRLIVFEHQHMDDDTARSTYALLESQGYSVFRSRRDSAAVYHPIRQAKVFGIGLSRTGTSSLNEALNLLGLNAKHFPKMISLQGQWRIDSTEITNHDALTDTPVTNEYQRLDQLYPGSKFILTIRDKTGWLESCRKYFGANQFNHRPDIRSLIINLYGVDHFNATAFSNAYDQHLAKVQVYFKDRPENLLILNICNGDGWTKLCAFLNKQVPQIDFPHL